MVERGGCEKVDQTNFACEMEKLNWENEKITSGPFRIVVMFLT